MANGTGADGSIRIDTELDNSGFEKGSAKLIAALEGIQKTLDSISDTLSEGLNSVIKTLQQLGSQAQSTAQTTSQAAQQTQSATESAAQSAQQAAQTTQQANNQTAQSARSTAAAQAAAASATQASTSRQSSSYAQIERSAQTLDARIRSLNVTASSGFKNEAQVMRFNSNLQTISQKVDALKQKLADLGSVQTPTEAYVQLEQELAKAEAELDKLRQKETEIVNAGLDFGAPWDAFIEKEAEASDKVDEIKAKMQSMKDAGTAFSLGSDSSEYASAAEQVNNLSDALESAQVNGQVAAQNLHALTAQDYMSAINAGFQSATSSIKAFIRQLNNVSVQAFKAAIDGLRKSLSKIGGACKSAAAGFLSLATGAGSASNPVNSLVRQLTSFKTMLLTRIKRTFMSDIFSDLQGAVQKFAQYNQSFNQAMSNIKNMGGTVAANIASLFGNLLAYIEPIVTKILSWINTLIIAINSLFAWFTGKKTIKVAKMQTGDYAKSLDSAGSSAGKAAKAQKKFNAELYSYDELTRQSKNDGSDAGGGGGGAGGGGGGFSEPAWEEMAVPNPDDLKEQFKNFLRNIPWDDIQKQAYALGEKIANALNKVFEDLELGQLLGKTIAEALNTALSFALGFLENFNWAQFGRWAGELWNAFVENFDFDKLAKVISTGVNGIISAIRSFFKTIYSTCYQLGQGIATVVNGILRDIDLTNAAKAIIAGVNDINRTLEGFNDTIDWKGAARNLSRGLNTLIHGMALNNNGDLVNVWEENGRQVGRLIGGFVSYINQVVNSADWKGLGHDIGAWFYNAIAGIDPKDFAGVISGVVNGIFDLISGFVEAVNWEDLANRIVTAINGMITGIDWEHMGQVIGELFKNVLQTLNTVIDEVDWVALGRGIGNALSGIDWPGVFLTIGKVIVEALGGMLRGIFSTKGGWATLGAMLFYGSLKFLATFGVKLFSAWLAQAALKQIIASALSSVISGGAAAGAPAAQAAIGMGSGGFFGKMITLVKTGVSKMAGVLTSAIPVIKSGLTKLISAFSSAAPAIGTAALAVGDAVLVAYDVSSLVKTNQEYKSLAEERNSATQTYCDNLAKIYAKGGQKALDAVTGSHMSLQEAQAKAQQDFADVPSNMWEGFKQGWSSYFGEGGSGLWGLVKDAFTGFIGSIKDFLGIASPSTVMADIGENTILGFINGLKAAAQSITGLATGIVEGLLAIFRGMNWGSVISTLSAAWSEIGNTLSAAWNGIKTLASNVFAGISTAISTAWNAISSVTSSVWTGIYSTLSGIWSGIQSVAASVWNAIKSNLSATWNTLKANATTIFTGIQTFLQTTWTNIRTTVTTVWNSIKTFLQTTWTTVKTTATTIFTNIKTFLQTTWNTVRSITQTTWNNIRTVLQTTWNNIRSNTQTSLNNMRSAMSNGWNTMRSNMASAWSSMLSSLRSYLGSMLSSIRGQISSWSSAGGNLVSGLLSGLQSAWSAVSSWVSSAASALSSRLRSAFRIHSPSKEWAEIGQFLDLGLVEGLQNGERSLLRQTDSLAQGMTDRLQGSGSVAMNGTVSGMDGVVSQLSVLANIFTGISQTLANIGSLAVPQIAAGTVVPAKVAVASAEYGAESADSAAINDIRTGLQSLIELLSGRGGTNGNSSDQTIQIMIDGKAVFQAVVNENNRAITRTGKSPIRV
ncbi:MAG: hypothetical protein ACI4ET_12760 [Bilifractor sp.]